MNKTGIILLLAIITTSTIVGAAATGANYRILPLTPITLNPQEETNQTSIRINSLNITSLTTTGLQMTPTPHLTHIPETQFEQGKIMGIAFAYSFSWHNLPRLTPNSSSTETTTEEIICFGGNLSAHFLIAPQVFGADGLLAADSGNFGMLAGGGSGTGNTRRDFFIQIPYSWTPGTYLVRIQVEELITGLQDCKEATVTIETGSPPEEKHPSPITAQPADMIIGPTDLPEGWILTKEDPNSTILDNCIASLKRSFSKTVGEFKNVFEIRVILFENVEEANSSFHNKLEAYRTNEQYGHGKVITENISDGCFLYDNDERRSLDWRGWTVEGNNASSWATGSCVAFFTQNVLITIGDSYNYGALTQGIFIPPEQLVDFARIQAARIPS